MAFLKISKFFMILFVPFIIFLSAAKLTAFNDSFYRQKFAEYEVQQNVPQAASINEKVMSFITGKNNEIPGEFNEREKQHLWDVRKIISYSATLLYALIALFTILFAISAFILKRDSHIKNLIGKILLFGGFLTILLAAILFFLISSDFSSTFESFHNLFFEKGTYTFDPAKEIIVRLYPEQLFMDLGFRIAKNAILISTAIILSGAFIIFI